MLIPFDYLFKKYNIKSEGVLHCGASTGQEAQAYYDNGIKTVIWVEAIPSVYEELCKNVEPYENSMCINACVSDVDGEIVDFNISNNEGQSSSMLDFDIHTTLHPTVKFIDKIKLKTYRLDSLLQSSGINLQHYNFLNFDLQCAELKALKGLGTLLNNFQYAYLEINFRTTYKFCPLVDEVDAYMATYGFKRVETSQIIGGVWADGFYIKEINAE